MSLDAHACLFYGAIIANTDDVPDLPWGDLDIDEWWRNNFQGDCPFIVHVDRWNWYIGWKPSLIDATENYPVNINLDHFQLCISLIDMLHKYHIPFIQGPKWYLTAGIF